MAATLRSEEPHETGSCSVCGGAFKRKHAGHRFCSKLCSTKSRRAARYPGIMLSDRRCEWCGLRIPEAKQANAKFCTDKCRSEAFNVKPCVYCGEPANSRDHFIPRAFKKRIEDLGWAKKGNVIVPACIECNSTAGANVFRTLTEKRRFIHDQYRTKYRKLLEAPWWTVDEISELGTSLRSHVQRSQYAKDLMRDRLRWPAH